jgi:hypothetical protein
MYTQSNPMSRLLATFLFASAIVMAQPVTVPLILEGNAPIVELEFPSASGIRKARFVVDTGGGAFILGSKLMADIGAKATGPASKDEPGVVPLEPVAVRLGGMALDLTGVQTIGLLGQRGPISRNDAEGLVPGRLLRNYEVVFDYPARRFTLAKPGAIGPRGVKVKTPISSSSGFPRIELQIGGVLNGFLLDTGASFTMISRAALDGWAKTEAAWPAATGAVGFANMFGGKMESEALMLRIAEIDIGTISLKNVAAVSRPEGTFEKYMSSMMTAPIIGALGGNVLRDFRVEIDYKNGFTYLERTASTEDADLLSVGLVLQAGTDGNPLVSGISSAAAADVKAQVQISDKLLAVDGAPLQGMSLAAVAAALQGTTGARKQLSLERDGKALTVSVTIKKLL